MKNPSTDKFEWLMTVVSRSYNSDRPGWNYKVKDSDGKEYPSEVVEDDLEDA